MQAATAPDPAAKHRNRLHADERRATLLTAALRVFARDGFRGAKTKDIATEAGVNEALLFRHFPSKDHIYAAILENVAVDQWGATVREAMAEAGDDPAACIRSFAAATLAWHRRSPELLRLVLYSALEQHELAEIFRDRQVCPVLELLTSFVTEQQARGRFARDIKPEHAARIIFGAVAHQGLVILILHGAESGMTDDEIVTAITRIALEGLERRPESNNEKTNK